MSIVNDLKPRLSVEKSEPMKCNCKGIDLEQCNYLLDGIQRELKADRPSDFKIHNIKRMIDDFCH